MNAWPFELNQRCLDLGLEIFERAHDARPRPWHSLWWEDKATAVLSEDTRLRIQLFRFLEVLPALSENTDIARHFQEYLCEIPLNLPRAVLHGVRSMRPQGPAGRFIGRLARLSARMMAHRFITGITEPEALAGVDALRRRRMSFTLDVLGESTKTERQADQYAERYHTLLDSLSPLTDSWKHDALLDMGTQGPMPRINLSVKLTSLEPRFDPITPRRTLDRVAARLCPLLRHARDKGGFVNVDMESFSVRDLTFEIFKDLMQRPDFRDWPDVGIVVQAYLRDSEQDLRDLLDWVRKRGTPLAVRLVKGAYWDYETAKAIQKGKPIPVWTQKWESDAQFERLAAVLLDHVPWVRPAFASHNARSLAFVLAYAESRGLQPREYEIQMLHGMGDALKQAVVGMGRHLRVYAPVGDVVPGMAYLIRRMLENSSNESFLAQAFKPGDPTPRLADPALQRPPSDPLPKPFLVDPHEEYPMEPFEHARDAAFGRETARSGMRDAIAKWKVRFGRTIPHIIDGARITGPSTTVIHTPADRTVVLARVAVGEPHHIDEAVASAAKAFETWRHLPTTDRVAIIEQVADIMERQRFSFAALLVLEAGKTWTEADGEVSEAIDYCRFYARQMERLSQRPRRRNLPGEDNVLLWEPRGVCAIVCTWSFPLALLANMCAAALVTGNPIVIKPSHRTPLMAHEFMIALEEAGVPAGTANLVHGLGPTVGAHLCDHPEVRMIAFTGSTPVGLELRERAAQSHPRQRHLKHFIGHMGGCNAVIVDSDADLDEAASGVLESAFACAGQKCSACRRVILLDSVYEAFAARLVDMAAALQVGNPEDPAIDVGPMIDDRAASRVREWIKRGHEEGEVLLDGMRPQFDGKEAYIGPTIVGGIPGASDWTSSEIFGPVLMLQRALTFEGALSIANDSPFALCGGVYSRSPEHLRKARSDFHVGNLFINRKITGSVVDQQPWGGVDLSGTGSKMGADSYLSRFCDLRTVSENTLRHGFAPDDTIEVSL